jgi:hypothetical protein
VASRSSRPRGLERELEVAHAARQRADLVERGSEGDQPEARHAPVARLEARHPHSAAGRRTEPPVSEPSASGTSPAATAAGWPLDEPPGVRVRSHGLRAAPKAEFSPDGAHRELVHVRQATGTAPPRAGARRRRRVGGRWPRGCGLPQFVSAPARHRLLFSTTGTPNSGLPACPRVPAIEVGRAGERALVEPDR